MQVRRSRDWARPLVAVLLAAVAVLASTTPAVADAEAEERRADRLHAEAEATEDQIAANEQRLAALAKEASAALEAYTNAVNAQRAAEEKARTAEADLAKAVDATAQQRLELQGYAANAYRSGGTGDLTVFAQLVSAQEPEGVIQSVGLLQRVGDKQAQMLLRFRVAAHLEAEARSLAESAVATAEEKAKAKEDAKQRADALVKQQQDLVAQLERQLAQTKGAERAARAEAARLKAAEAAIQRRYGPLATCGGGSVSGYSNGRLPEAALCPLWGAPGHKLRADAAAGFNAMSRAFAAEFGSPICVSSSYRTYDQQASLYASKPGLAAPPGQSNHGWGLAADLCGSVASDGTSANNWLRGNSGRWSWFHPSWADAGGSGAYEPWHWEYAG